MGHNNSFFYLIQKLLIITIQNKTHWISLQNATIFKLFVRNNKRDFNKNLFPHHFRKERTAANSLFYSDFFFPRKKSGWNNKFAFALGLRYLWPMVEYRLRLNNLQTKVCDCLRLAISLLRKLTVILTNSNTPKRNSRWIYKRFNEWFP